MQLFAVITSNQTGMIPDFGTLSPKKPLVMDEYKMIRIEAKRRCKFGEIAMPVGFNVVLHILEDDEEFNVQGA